MITGTIAKTTAHDLDGLVEKGILRLEGRGRGVATFDLDIRDIPRSRKSRHYRDNLEWTSHLGVATFKCRKE